MQPAFTPSRYSSPRDSWKHRGNFETSPFFLESEYAGPNLAEWAEAQGGLSKVSYETRLQLLVDVAKAVAAAHDIGVLHKDLKPANVLVVPGTNGGWQIRLADFGSASLFDPSRLQALGITNLGFTQTASLEARALTGPSCIWRLKFWRDSLPARVPTYTLSASCFIS